MTQMNLVRIWLSTLFIATVLMGCSPADETDVRVSEAWARATNPGQEVGAAYMTLRSEAGATLNRVESDVAGSVEIHSMTMDDGVMKMRMLESLTLPPGKEVTLSPGDFHLMLFELKKPLLASEQIQFTLHFSDAKGKSFSQSVQVPVKQEAE